MKCTRPIAWLVLALCAVMLASCASGQVRRVSDPGARIQQLTVQPGGDWQVEVRLQNFSSIPMRFDAVALQLRIGDTDAGTLEARPALQIGPESADVVQVTLVPSTGAKLLVADALAAGRGTGYTLEGTITATPEDERQRTFRLDPRRSALSPAPGLPGVMR